MENHTAISIQQVNDALFGLRHDQVEPVEITTSDVLEHLKDRNNFWEAMGRENALACIDEADHHQRVLDCIADEDFTELGRIVHKVLAGEAIAAIQQSI